jgi:hypothetical protein
MSKNDFTLKHSQVRSCFINLIARNIIVQTDHKNNAPFRSYGNLKFANKAVGGSYAPFRRFLLNSFTDPALVQRGAAASFSIQHNRGWYPRTCMLSTNMCIDK